MEEEEGYCAGSHLGGGGACVGPARRRCGSCGAVRYCSVAHQRAHWLEHKESCQRMVRQMEEAEALNEFPFPFTKEFAIDNHMPCSFLEKLGLHGKGLWKGECKCLNLKSVTIKGQAENDEGWHLRSSLCPCTAPPRPDVGEIKDWSSYYGWRQLPLCSPVALLLHQPLTLFHALSLIGGRNANFSTTSQNSLNIHYLGPEREIDQIGVFAELLCLLPRIQINIDFVGPAVPSSRDQEIVSLCGYAKCLDDDCDCKFSSLRNEEIRQGNSDRFHRNLTIQFWKGLYHDRYEELAKKGKADLVLAPNAGVAAFPSWRETIELLSMTRLPTIMTDYCREACILATKCISTVHGRPLSHPFCCVCRYKLILSDSH
ncbi:hypothetical protein O6H91_09G040700 [Diphasiastrum complanatum]|uniref:Uncharacterized protein n=1 Tax=Diphasiastrum complanatum TaxID=34168 RepID=A0ACC2CNN0_DIPCM|nr:hypothetical protein O6H91_09G040700 [Diphasiastrum complanatum]